MVRFRDPFSTPARRRRIVADLARIALKGYCIEACKNVARSRLENKCSLTIQCFYRCFKAKRILNLLKFQLYTKSSIIIQKYIRRKLAINLLNLLRRKWKLYWSKKLTVYLEKLWTLRKDKLFKIALTTLKKNEREKMLRRKAIFIQKIIRGHQARTNYSIMLTKARNLLKLKNSMALLIQTQFRRYLCRKRYLLLILKLKSSKIILSTLSKWKNLQTYLKSRSAIKIQAKTRKLIMRLKYKKLLANIELKRISAIKIQSTYRRYIAVKRYKLFIEKFCENTSIATVENISFPFELIKNSKSTYFLFAISYPFQDIIFEKPNEILKWMVLNHFFSFNNVGIELGILTHSILNQINSEQEEIGTFLIDPTFNSNSISDISNLESILWDIPFPFSDENSLIIWKINQSIEVNLILNSNELISENKTIQSHFEYKFQFSFQFNDIVNPTNLPFDLSKSFIDIWENKISYHRFLSISEPDSSEEIKIQFHQKIHEVFQESITVIEPIPQPPEVEDILPIEPSPPKPPPIDYNMMASKIQKLALSRIKSRAKAASIIQFFYYRYSRLSKWKFIIRTMVDKLVKSIILIQTIFRMKLSRLQYLNLKREYDLIHFTFGHNFLENEFTNWKAFGISFQSNKTKDSLHLNIPILSHRNLNVSKANDTFNILHLLDIPGLVPGCLDISKNKSYSFHTCSFESYVPQFIDSIETNSDCIDNLDDTSKKLKELSILDSDSSNFSESDSQETLVSNTIQDKMIIESKKLESNFIEDFILMNSNSISKQITEPILVFPNDDFDSTYFDYQDNKLQSTSTLPEYYRILSNVFNEM